MGRQCATGIGGCNLIKRGTLVSVPIQFMAKGVSSDLRRCLFLIVRVLMLTGNISSRTGLGHRTLDVQGISREELIPTVRALIEAMLAIPGSVIIGHNITGFDLPFIEYFTTKVGCPIKLPRDRIFDTGAMYKANKLGMLPAGGEAMWNFFVKVRDIRARGVLWNLGLAAEELGVVEKYGLDLSGAHDASFDVLITHYVYQEMRGNLLVAA